jgi:hypothetical protein
MQKNCKYSSKKLSTQASKTLRAKTTSKSNKSLAGSVLSQTPKRDKKESVKRKKRTINRVVNKKSTLTTFRQMLLGF